MMHLFTAALSFFSTLFLRFAAGLLLGVLLLTGAMAQSAGTWYPVDVNGVNPEKRHESSFVEVNGKFYLIGGRGTRTVQVYDPQTQQWSNAQTSTNNIHHFQAVAYQGKIYIFNALQGNGPDEDPVTNVLMYDPVADQMTTGAAVPTHRQRGGGGVVLYQGKFYLVAGNRNGHRAFLDDGVTPANVAWFDSYDPATNQWATLPDAPHARDHFHAAVIGDKLYVAGGRRSRDGTSDGIWKDTEAAVDVYDFAQNRWLNTGESPQNLPTQRAGAAVVVIGSELLVIGGEIDNAPSNLALKTTEALNPLNGTWRALANLNLGRHASQAILYNGDVYLPAGSKTKGGTEITYAETFMEVLSFDGPPNAPTTYPTWTTVSNAPIPRSEAQVVEYNGELYFFNGFAPNIKIENSCAKYDPVQNAWTALAPMPNQPNGKPWAVTHNGIALVSDTVWIVGGRVGDNPGPVTNRVWWYKISTNSWHEGPALPLPAGGGGLGRLGRKLHYVGGFDGNASCDVDHHLVYDLDQPAAGWQLQPASPMPDARNHFGTVVMNGKLYTLGGQHGHDGCGGGADVATVHVYDPVTDQWSQLANLLQNQSHIEPSSFALDGKLYVVGGEITGNKVYEYTPQSNQWKQLADLNLPEPLLAPGARIFGSTLVVAVGGAPSTSYPTAKTRKKTLSRTPYRALSFQPGAVSLQLAANATQQVEVLLANSAETVPYQLNTTGLPNWLQVNKTQGTARESFEELTLTLNSAGLPDGTYAYTLTANAAGYASAALSVQLTIGTSTPPPTGDFVLRLNAGGPTVNFSGETYTTDAGTGYYTSDHTYSNTGLNLPALYQTERGSTADQGTLSYAIPVPNGQYTVRTHHAELYFGHNGPAAQAGQRVFDISLEGTLVDNDLDLFTVSGGAPVVRTFSNVSVADGVLNLTMQASANRPTLAGLEIVGVTETTPPPTPLSTYRINAGGPTQTVNGITWTGCQTGNCQNWVTGGFVHTDFGSAISGVNSPLNQNLYQTEWTGGQTNGVPAGQVAFGYHLPVVNGTYQVRLYFAELNKNGVGKRVFDVNLEGGAKEFVNFDIFQAAGGENVALMRQFSVTVSDGVLDIDFIRQIENAKVSAIEVVPAGTTPDETQTFWLEAECGQVGSNWQVLSDGNTSQGYYAAIKSGLNSMANAPADVAANRIRFQVQAATAGTFHLFARLKAPNGNDDSFWVRVNGGSWMQWWQGLQTGNAFAWKEVMNSPFALQAGFNTIDVAYREDGTLLDKLYLTTGTTLPTGLGDAASNCGTEPTAPITLTLVNALTDQDLGTLTNGMTLNLAQIGTNQLSVRATPQPAQVGSVLFSLTGPLTHQQTENVIPYALFGDNEGDLDPGTFAPGTYQLQATSYAQAKGSGNVLAMQSIQFQVINSSASLQPTSPNVMPALVLYPNPTSGEVTLMLETSVAQAPAPVRIRVVDVLGKVWYTSEHKAEGSTFSHRLTTHPWPAGVYLIQVSQGEHHRLQKLIKE
ncbi:Por secretion system C-terminal sorting domain-containing protein [Catalinimonas alkaloidigena]|uniref:Por secretion system C-terminal sorting domain-containing protein n=1 Tax=Catalinimonas alkaloidigena TaxID=1075417 RepID=A0A1G9HAX3_9BACT|nr:malectin domain-containing carbohydrate-binding protein [Catalinimonas alkaloidigena]SDL10100.1 Por secretion system C-terminal sorting domain-containing protein [Catalinimonas alkaloidigena]